MRRAARRRARVAGASQRETENAKVRTSSLGSRSNAGLISGRSASVPGPEAVSKRDVDQAALQLAVGEGRIERLGSLYVARAGDDELTWNEAQDRCRGKRINGVQGFRLPGISELRKIRAARLLGAATYWARNRGAQQDEAVAYDAKAGTTALYLKLEPNARTVCVRTL